MEEAFSKELLQPNLLLEDLEVLGSGESDLREVPVEPSQFQASQLDGCVVVHFEIRVLQVVVKNLEPSENTHCSTQHWYSL